MNASRIDDLIATLDATAIRRAVETAYNRGFQDGEAAFKRAVNGLTVAPAQSKAGESPPVPQTSPRESDGAKRAPRGLTRAVIFKILRANPTLSMTDIQERAVAEDAQVSGKTVYNELKRERGKLYREFGGMWSLIEGRSAEPVGFPSIAKEEDADPYQGL